MKKCRHNIENSLIVSERITNLAEHNDHDEDQTDHQDGYQDQDVGPAVKYSGYTEGINLMDICCYYDITGNTLFLTSTSGLLVNIYSGVVIKGNP